MYNSYGNEEICRILKNIVRLQREAVKIEIQDEMCDFNRLGGCSLNGARYNTRPIEIYTRNDNAWSCPINRDNGACTTDEKTCVFRVEKVEGDTATFRALIETITPSGPVFTQTDSFITIKINEIAAIRCLRDAFVDLCII